MYIIKNNVQLAKNFKLSEFVCKCGCNSTIIDMRVVEALQKVRDKVGPVTIAAGFRCPAHNAKVKGASPNSRHMSGLAVDIKSNVTVYKLAAECYRAGFKGIGISDNKPYGYYYVHADIRDTESYWVYDKNNQSKAITKTEFLKLIAGY